MYVLSKDVPIISFFARFKNDPKNTNSKKVHHLQQIFSPNLLEGELMQTSLLFPRFIGRIIIVA